MKTLQINLGLNNNPFTENEIVSYFSNNNDYRLMAHYVINKGNEPIFVAILEYKFARQSKVLQDFEMLCRYFNQSSIALVTEFMQVVAFNVSVVTTSYNFDALTFEFIKPL